MSYHPNGTADLSAVRSLSVTLAVSAGALGFAFGAAVLMITRKKLTFELDVYRANGLPFTSALSMMVRYHPLRPLLWLLCTAAVAIGGDLAFGLDYLIPLYLAALFAALLLGWMVSLTGYVFSERGFRKVARVG